MRARPISETEPLYFIRLRRYCRELDFKRIIDIVLSMLFLIITAPILLVCMLLIKLESEGAVFYRQRQLSGRSFSIIKLRSMRWDAEKSGPWCTAKNDPRITRIGAFMRKIRLDEFPQFINVLKGDMSLVGPRPLTEQYTSQVLGFRNRLKVKPGITGWAQINGGNDISLAEKY